MTRSDSTERRERRDAQRNLERVLQAARELFAQSGERVKMEDVARRAGVGVGTVYRCFESKEDLFAAVSSAACAATRHSLSAAAEDAPDPLARLHAIILVQFHRAEEQATLLDMRPDAGEGAPHPGEAAEPQALYETLHAMLAQVIAEGQCQGHMRQGDPAVLAALSLELLHPRTFLHLRRIAAGDAETFAAHVASFLLHALRKDEG